MISYDDFAKLDIRIGEIMSVEVVPDADKLLALTVNFGETDEEGVTQHRSIISGIREFFADPATLVGTKCPFVTNLEPRTIRGRESAGMILAAGGKEGVPFALLSPSADLPPGTKVS
jgi:methionyl-tRNA synthetase